MITNTVERQGDISAILVPTTNVDHDVLVKLTRKDNQHQSAVRVPG